jgi:L-threonine ammonia-lyase (EC 4.3.1.19)
MIRKDKSSAGSSGADGDRRAALLRAYRRRIERARVYEVATVTPLQPAPRLSARVGHRVLLKREDQQSVHSFKLRGPTTSWPRSPRRRAPPA